MNLNILKTLYTKSPLILKRVYSCIPLSFRVPRIYKIWRKYLKETPSSNTIENINKTLEVAKNIPAYQFPSYNVKTLDEFEQIPIYNKEEIQKNINDFISKRPNSMFYVSTSGSTGRQAKFFQSSNVWWKELAYFHDFLSVMGYDPANHYKASFRGGDFAKLNVMKNIFWVANPIYKEIHFSPFHINVSTIKYYVQKLNKTKPAFFHTYPSSLLNLIRCMKVSNLKLSYQLQGVVLISEGFTEKDEKEIRDFFQCEVKSFYGLSERVVFAYSMKDCSSYKIDERYGYFELIDGNGIVIKENGKRGEIVGTSFDNYAMPLIRYKTGDFTKYIDYKNRIIERIEGKWDRSYFIGYNEEMIYLSALNFHDNVFDKVSNFQYYQEKKGVVQILLVPKQDFKDTDKITIIERHQERVGNLIEFTIKIIDQPILSKSGKVNKLILNY